MDGLETWWMDSYGGVKQTSAKKPPPRQGEGSRVHIRLPALMNPQVTMDFLTSSGFVRRYRLRSTNHVENRPRGGLLRC